MPVCWDIRVAWLHPMPMNFAVKMWGWTRWARGSSHPGEMTPSSFSHPLLSAQKPTPTAVASAETNIASAAKSDRAMVADVAIAPAPSVKPGQAHTADASGLLPKTATPATMSDATPAARGAAPNHGSGDASSAEAKPAATPTAAAMQAVKVSETSTEPANTGDNKVEAIKTDATLADPKKDKSRPTGGQRSRGKIRSRGGAARSSNFLFVSPQDNKLMARRISRRCSTFSGVGERRPLGTHVFWRSRQG